MSAECEKHGIDLVGYQFSEGGLTCYACERDDARAEVKRLREAGDALRDAVHHVVGQQRPVLTEAADAWDRAVTGHTATGGTP